MVYLFSGVIAVIIAALVAVLFRFDGFLIHRRASSYFSEAEYICATGHPPEKWIIQMGRRSRDGKDLTTARVVLRDRLTRLIAYLEKSRFIENGETRLILLKRLYQIRVRMEKLGDDEILRMIGRT